MTRPPKILNDDTMALWRRFIIIDFPNTFPDDTADKNLARSSQLKIGSIRTSNNGQRGSPWSTISFLA